MRMHQAMQLAYPFQPDVVFLSNRKLLLELLLCLPCRGSFNRLVRGPSSMSQRRRTVGGTAGSAPVSSPTAAVDAAVASESVDAHAAAAACNDASRAASSRWASAAMRTSSAVIEATVAVVRLDTGIAVGKLVALGRAVTVALRCKQIDMHRGGERAIADQISCVNRLLRTRRTARVTTALAAARAAVRRL